MTTNQNSAGCSDVNPNSATKGHLGVRLNAWIDDRFPNYWLAVLFGFALAGATAFTLRALALPDLGGLLGLGFFWLSVLSGVVICNHSLRAAFKKPADAMRQSALTAGAILLTVALGWLLGINILNMVAEVEENTDSVASLGRLSHTLSEMDKTGGRIETLNRSYPELWTEGQKTLYSIKVKSPDAVIAVNTEAMAQWCASTQSYAESNSARIATMGKTQGGGFEYYGQKMINNMLLTNGCISASDYMSRQRALNEFTAQNTGVFYNTWKPLDKLLLLTGGSPTIRITDRIIGDDGRNGAVFDLERYCGMIGHGLGARAGVALAPERLSAACAPLIAESKALALPDQNHGLPSAKTIAWFEAELPAALGLK